MGGWLSRFRANDGAFEQPGAKRIAAFVADRDALFKPPPPRLDIPNNDDRDHHQSPLSPTPTSSTSKSTSKSRVGNSPILDPYLKTPPKTAVFSPNKPIPTQPARRTSLTPARVPEPARRPMETPPVPVGGPSTSTSTSTISEKTQGELVAQLYSSNIPAEDIALVVKAMRGGCTTEEHAQLLHKLFKLDVSSTLMAQLMDVIRAAPRSSVYSNTAVVRSDGVGEMPDDPPPVYDFKVNDVVEYAGAP